MKILTNILEAIGHTPLIDIVNMEGQKARLVVKAERFNPGGSVKDRTAYNMIVCAEQDGSLRPGATIIEPTSGNTGVGLALVASQRGYKTILTMPDTMSKERRALLQAYGAELVLTPGKDGMQGAIERAEQLHREIPDSVILGQFTNPANPRVHELTTGEEIWQDTDGQVAAFVAGIGTGGTLTGTARALKKHNPKVHIVGVEPANSAVISGGSKGAHGQQGIGAGFVPKTCDVTLIDEMMQVTDEEAFAAARMLARKYGILAGISSGTAFAAAAKLARREEFKNKIIVALLPDTGERYLSTGIFD